MKIDPTDRWARWLAGGAGAMDFVTGLGLVLLPAFTLSLMRVPVPGAEALAYVRFTGVFVGSVGASYLWALLKGGPAALRTVFQVTMIFRGGAGTFTGVGVATGMFHPAWLAVTFTDLGLVAAQGWLLRKGLGRDA
ncbi:MAG: hypothetical protein B9S34_14460 [Opitutia bacterium Tous-C1TDCM]|nr:MAG: hypothetical protein B9S34_14460 [Opitutae bacterium Tous-C1TDCM]